MEFVVRSPNLWRFAKVVSDEIGYVFDDADRDALDYGLDTVQRGSTTTYAYPLVGTECAVDVIVRRGDSSDEVRATIFGLQQTSARVDSYSYLLRYFDAGAPDFGLMKLIEELFQISRPAASQIVVCPEHDVAAGYSECYHAQRFFTSVAWQELVERGVPRNYAGFGWLTRLGQRYFLPAYIVAAIVCRDSSILTDALHAMPYRSHRLSESEQSVVDAILELVEEIAFAESR